MRLALILIAFLLPGCATQYAPYQASKGGFEDRRLDDGVYLLRYSGSIMSGKNQLTELWQRRAKELCGGYDFGGKPELESAKAVKGIVFCYGGFIDTRNLAPDEHFLRFKQMSAFAFRFEPREPIYQAFMAEDFATLSKLLEAKVNDSETPAFMKERELEQILNLMVSLDPEHVRHIQAWREAEPDNYFARYIDALYLLQLAWHHRGDRFWKYVSESGKKEFKKFQLDALKEAEAALKIDGDLPFAPALIISIIRTNNELFDYPENYDQAFVNSYPTSYGVRASALSNLWPRWGGSHKKMQMFIDESMMLIEQNPLFENFKGAIEIDKGDQALWKKDFSRAQSHYEEGIRLGTGAYGKSQLANLYLRNNRIVEAQQLLEAAIADDPSESVLYHQLAAIEVKQGDFISAVQMLNVALFLDPLNAAYFYDLGLLYYSMRLYELAEFNFQQALANKFDKVLATHWLEKSKFQVEIRGESNGPEDDATEVKSLSI